MFRRAVLRTRLSFHNFRAGGGSARDSTAQQGPGTVWWEVCPLPGTESWVSGPTGRRPGLSSWLLHLTQELLHLDLDDVVSRHNHEAEVARRHVGRDRLLSAGGGERGLLDQLLLRRLPIFVRMGKHDVAVLDAHPECINDAIAPCQIRGMATGRLTGSVHLNSPRNMRPSVAWMRRFLFSRDERNPAASAFSGDTSSCSMVSTDPEPETGVGGEKQD